MITRKSEYVYVIGRDVDADHPLGDMDRLKTSFDPVKGGIMPERTGYNQDTGVRYRQIISGEDVCFLREAVRERQAIFGLLDPTDPLKAEFSRVVSSSQIAGIVTDLHDLVTGSRVLTAFPTDGDYDQPDAEEYFARLDPTTLLSSPADFGRGHALVADDVNNIFSDLRNVNSFAVPAQSTIMGQSVTGNIGSYDPDYPMTYKTLSDIQYAEIIWDGGVRDSDHPHRNGGLMIGDRSFIPHITIRGLTADIMPVEMSASLSVGCVYYFDYISQGEHGELLDEDHFVYYSTCTSSLQRNGEDVYSFPVSTIRTDMIAVAQSRLGWNPSLTDDHYGIKFLRANSIRPYFIIRPSNHTRGY